MFRTPDPAENNMSPLLALQLRHLVLQAFCQPNRLKLARHYWGHVIFRPIRLNAPKARVFVGVDQEV